MTGEQIIVALVIAAAALYMVLTTWRKYVRRGGKSCCGTGNPSTTQTHVRLTMGDKTLRR